MVLNAAPCYTALLDLVRLMPTRAIRIFTPNYLSRFDSQTPLGFFGSFFGNWQLSFDFLPRLINDMTQVTLSLIEMVPSTRRSGLHVRTERCDEQLSIILHLRLTGGIVSVQWAIIFVQLIPARRKIRLLACGFSFSRQHAWCSFSGVLRRFLQTKRRPLFCEPNLTSLVSHTKEDTTSALLCQVLEILDIGYYYDCRTVKCPLDVVLIVFWFGFASRSNSRTEGSPNSSGLCSC